VRLPQFLRCAVVNTGDGAGINDDLLNGLRLVINKTLQASSGQAAGKLQQSCRHHYHKGLVSTCLADAEWLNSDLE